MLLVSDKNGALGINLVPSCGGVALAVLVLNYPLAEVLRHPSPESSMGIIGIESRHPAGDLWVVPIGYVY